MSELTILRMNMLGGMDAYVRNLVSDDEDHSLLDFWLMIFPDKADEDDLREMAEDNECWLDCVHAFDRICRTKKIY